MLHALLCSFPSTRRRAAALRHLLLLRRGCCRDCDMLPSPTLSPTQVVVDGVVRHPSEHMVYKGALLSGIPNCAFCLGYTNASWTLKVGAGGWVLSYYSATTILLLFCYNGGTLPSLV